MSREKIEEQLVEEFDLGTLAVYADILQAEGDPRGTVIALQLTKRDARGAILRWLGELAEGTKVEYGFVTKLELASGERGTKWLAHPASRYLRGVRLVGNSGWLATAAEQLVDRSGRWLTDLAFELRKGDPISNDRARRVLSSAPRLERLGVYGSRVLGDVGHPNVRSLSVVGAAALSSIMWTGDTRFPAVTELTLGLAGNSDLTLFDRLPALRKLDLSLNEPRRYDTPHSYGYGAGDALRTLGDQVGREQLTQLRLPSMRSQFDADELIALLPSMPALEEVEIARAYSRHDVHLPASVKQPANRWPWPPPDEAEGQIDISSGHDDYSVLSLITWLEAKYDRLTKPQQAAWSRFFEFVDQQDGEGATMPPKILRDALVTLDDDPTAKFWHWLRDELARRDVHVMVRAWL